MIERAVVEYLANALWQIPLLAGGAWLFLWAVRPGPRMQHGIWLAVLGLAVLLPGRGLGSAGGFAAGSVRVGAGAGAGSLGSTVYAPGFAPVSGSIAAADLVTPAGRSGELEMPLRKRAAAGWSWMAMAPRVRRVRVGATAVDWLVGAYGAAVLFGLLRVVRAWRTARRLVADSVETAVCACEMAFLEGYGQRLGVRLPELRESSAVSSPMIVGLVVPVLLLPEGFSRHTAEEVRAALCHELAHVQRRDYLVNLLCQVVALPVCWHPATYGVQQRIRRTREMVCDAMAAREMPSELGYARCLVAMARSMVGGASIVEQAAGLGLFGSNVLEERVMRLMETEAAMSVRTKVVRAASGAAMLVAAIAVTAMFHVAPTMAAQKTAGVPSAPYASGVSSPGPQTAPGAPAAPAAPAAVVAPAAPAAPVAPHELESPPAPEAPVVLAPVAPVAPVAPAVPVAPLAPVAPFVAGDAPTAIGHGKNARVVVGNGEHIHRWKGADGSPFVIANGEVRELTPEEERAVEREMAVAEKKMEEATAMLNSPEFKGVMERAQREAEEATVKVNSPEFKKLMEDTQMEATEATAKVNSPEFKKLMEETQKAEIEANTKLNSPEFKKQMEDAHRQAAEATAKINSPEFKRQMEDARKQMAEATAKMNSPEFKKQIQDAVQQSLAAKNYVDSAAFKEQMAVMQKQLAEATAKINSGEIQRQIDDAMRKLNEMKSSGDAPPK
jgi:beta-lactamase regulating signal transducer with metallopeptidase domain/mevalonate kinase